MCTRVSPYALLPLRNRINHTHRSIECYFSSSLSSNSATDSSAADHRIFLNQILPKTQSIEFENLPNVVNREHLNNEQHDYQQSSCQLVQIVHLLNHVGCQPKAIASFACTGSCPSYVQMSSSKFWQHERSCSCCQQTGLKEATFTLDCPPLDPPYRKVKTYAPVDCICRACTDLGKENLQPQELIEALAGDGRNNQKD